MREYQIKIDPFPFIALQELRMEQEINKHGKAWIAMRIKDEWKNAYMNALLEETWVKIMAKGEDEDSSSDLYAVMFCGLVTDYSFSLDGYETLFRLKVTSGSIRMDRASHFRIFQNEDSLCEGIYRQLTDCYSEGRIVCMEGNQDKTDGVVVQYEETDWEFLKRLASKTGRYLVPDATGKGAGCTVGLPMGVQRTLPKEKIKIKFDREEYMQKVCNGMRTLQAADMQEFMISIREIWRIGDSVWYQGKNYFVWKICTEYERAECIHTYYLRTKEAIRTVPAAHQGISGCSFHAAVTDVRQDKVQIAVDQDEWGARDGKKWFLFSTVYSSGDGTGWYCMPEIGDSVRLYVPEKEEGSFVISAVHKETDRARQNPDYKSWKTKYGKEILFTPNGILITNNQGMMVEMDDSEGITIASDRDIVIEAEDNLTISSANASLLIAAEDVLQVKQGGTSMTLDKDIIFTGGEFRIQ